MKLFALLLSVAMLAGCSTYNQVLEPVNGQIFLAGDKECARYRPISSGVIQCFNSEGRPAGNRRALTSQELQYYQMRQMQQQQQAQYQSMMLQQQIAQNQMASQQYTANVYQSISNNMPSYQLGSWAYQKPQVRCISASIYTNCRAY
ncbi:hypothetical protein [Martelella mediterranea]|uniref:Uncharacterized protein n=1 Tax=Martelella mediterranea TaxID=293089 RepID=A0A4R3NK26_9HYPH|nr:hypothetical protein [Martelella mediterranea]TCT29745.1 hypothetical protein EDC90_104817 [Martelella mediterranea]